MNRRNLAMALSNRGVLWAIGGELEKARADFLAAVDLKSGIEIPGTNLARLERDISQTESGVGREIIASN